MANRAENALHKLCGAFSFLHKPKKTAGSLLFTRATPPTKPTHEGVLSKNKKPYYCFSKMSEPELMQ